MSHIHELGTTYLADELLLLHIGSVVVVWNLVQDTWAKLDIGEREDAQTVCRKNCGRVILIDIKSTDFC